MVQCTGEWRQKNSGSKQKCHSGIVLQLELMKGAKGPWWFRIMKNGGRVDNILVFGIGIARFQ